MSGSSGSSRIRVVGVGGAGIGAINYMIEKGIERVAFHAVDTEVEGLADSGKVANTLLIGKTVARSTAADGDLDAGRRAAEESRDRIHQLLNNASLVFVTAGMGGGTGSGAAPIIARIAKHEVKALTVAIVTYPFGFEGPLRRHTAVDGIEALRRAVDTLLVIPHDRFGEISEKPVSVADAFCLGYALVYQVVQTLTEMITKPTLLHRDFADVRSIMLESGSGLMTTGHASGENRAVEVAVQATRSGLLDVSIDGAQGILLNVTGDSSMTLLEVNQIASVISDSAHPDVSLILGFTIDECLGEGIKVTLIATGFDRGTALKIRHRTEGTSGNWKATDLF